MSISRESIEDTVKNGLLGDIFRFERNLALIRKIVEYASLINDSSNGNFGRAFNSIKSALSTEAVLAATRINDKPNNRYPTRCLRGLLKYLEQFHRELPCLREEYQLLQLLSTRDNTKYLIDCVKNSPNDFSVELKRYVFFELEVTPLVDLSQELKTYRDKVLAHNENAENIVSPHWVSIEELISLAKFVVGVLGWAYFSTAYSVNGEYILTRDAMRSSICLDRLIKRLYGVGDGDGNA